MRANVAHPVAQLPRHVAQVDAGQESSQRAARSSAFCGRSFGSSAIALAITSSRGRSRMSASLGFGCGALIAASISSGRPPEGRLPAPQLDQQDRDREDVGRGRELPALHLLGRHVPRRAEDALPVGAVATGAAMPKSMTLTCPSSSTITLRGVTSRCTTFIRRCA